MVKVAIIGHSNLKGIADETGKWYSGVFQIEVFCCPGATTDNITSFPEYSRLVHNNFDVVILFLGANDIRESCSIAEIYEKLKNLIDDLNNQIIPKYGTFLLEPEARRGDPKYINEKGYFRLRNSLVRKIKKRKEIESWTLVGRGLHLRHLKKDGVHLSKEGKKKFKEIIEGYLIQSVRASKLKVRNKSNKAQPGNSGGNARGKAKKFKNQKGKATKHQLDEQKNYKRGKERKSQITNKRKIKLD